MKIYELRCFCRNYESYEDYCSYTTEINFYATRKLAENAIRDLKILEITAFEFPKVIKEYTQEELDTKENSVIYYIRRGSEYLSQHHNYTRGFKISEAYDEEDNDLEREWKLWDYLFEIVEHELIEA